MDNIGRELLETAITAIQMLCVLMPPFAIAFMVWKGAPLLAKGIKNKVFSSFFFESGFDNSLHSNHNNVHRLDAFSLLNK